MVRKCCYPGCDSTSGLHALPSDSTRVRQWLVALGKDGVCPYCQCEKTAGLTVCNLHFSRQCFENYVEVEMGFVSKSKLRLREDAVPNPVAHLGSRDQPTVRDAACQTEPACVQHSSVQANVKPARRSKALQARAPSRSVYCDTDTLAVNSEPLNATSTSLKRPRDDIHLDDSSFHPDGTSSCTVNSDRSINETPPHKIKKYTVYEENLVELSKKCPDCESTCIVNSRTVGTLLHVEQVTY